MQNLGVLSPEGNQHLAEAPAATPVPPGPGPTPVVPPAPYPGMSAAGAARMATGEARSKKVKVQEFRLGGGFKYSYFHPYLGKITKGVETTNQQRFFREVPLLGAKI